jgi:hypothetical protein
MCFIGCESCWAATTQVAVLPDSSDAARNLATLLELDLAETPGIRLVERQQLDKVIQEQQLSAALSPEAPAKRVALGKLAGADALVFVTLNQTPKPHFDLVVSETRNGLRLLVRPLGPESDVQGCEKRAVSLARSGIDKAAEKVAAIVAVPPFLCTDLTLAFAGQGSVYSTLVEESLLRRPGVVVVELAEARAIATEMAIAARQHLDRPEPLFLLGEYRTSGPGESRKTDLRLAIKRGNAELAAVSAKGVESAQLPATLEELTDKIFAGKLSGRPPAAQNPASEAKSLYERGKTFFDVSLWDRADQLFEASLMLAPSPEVHRDDAVAILEKYTSESFRDQEAAGPNDTFKRRIEFRTKHLPELRRGLAHTEAWVASTPVRFTKDFWPTRYLSQVPPAEAIESLTRMIRAKAASGVADDTFRYIRATALRELPDAGQRYAGGVALADLANKERDVDLGGVKDSPELRSALDQMSKSTNPFTREAANRTRTSLAKMAESLATSANAKSNRPPPAPAKSDAGHATIGRVDLGEVGSVLGWLKAGDQDLVWTCLNPGETPGRLWEVLPGWERRWLANFDFHCRPSFDGRYVWTGANPNGKPVLEIIDPGSGKKWLVQAKDGLPDAPILRLASAPLAVGKMCVAAEIGEERSPRSWIGIVTFDPASGSSVSILHEAKRSPLVDRSQKDAPDVAFSPSEVTVLKAAGSQAGAPATVVVAAPGHYLTFTLPADRPQVRYDRTLSYSYQRGAAVSHGGKLYWVRKDWRKPYTVSIECAAAGQDRPTIVQTGVPEGALTFVGKKVYLAGCDGSLSVADRLGAPFERLTVPGGQPQYHHEVRFCRSMNHGMLIIFDEQLYEVLGSDRKPLLAGAE